MPKFPLTKEQETNLLWLEIKKDNNELSHATYQAVKACIINNKPIIHIKEATAIEKKYLAIFAEEKAPEKLFAECINEYNRVQEIKKTKEIKQSKFNSESPPIKKPVPTDVLEIKPL